SPELAAIRWAARAGVEVAPCDLPVGHPGWAASRESTVDSLDLPEEEPLVEIARSGLTGRTGEDLWDRWVEAASPGSSPDSVRRAALAVGWAMRRDAETSSAGVERRDLNREAWMRQRLADAGPRRVAMVVGAFHAPALLVSGDDQARLKGSRTQGELVTSMVPYTFDLLDSRSGYPAGIRDPQWQQAVLDCGADP